MLLSVVRAVLDPDRRRPVDHHVRADLAGISLDTAHVRVDVEDLLADAADAAARCSGGDADRAREVLAEVDARYRGDAFDDEPYEDWATGCGRRRGRRGCARCASSPTWRRRR